MGIRWTNEPPYPASQEAMDAYCSSVVSALEEHLADRLRAVLLAGSWARGEARPPESDVDMTVVVDRVDGGAIRKLQSAWQAVGVGPANVFGWDEVAGLPRDVMEMFTTNAVVLWGTNPFRSPTPIEMSADLGRAAEVVARDSRALLLYHWFTDEERLMTLTQLKSKWGVSWAMKCLVGVREGVFPPTAEEARNSLVGTAEGDLWFWTDSASTSELLECYERYALTVNDLARSWLRECVDRT